MNINIQIEKFELEKELIMRKNSNIEKDILKKFELEKELSMRQNK